MNGSPVRVLMACPDPVEPLDLVPVERVLAKCFAGPSAVPAYQVRVERFGPGSPGLLGPAGAPLRADVVVLPGGPGAERVDPGHPLARAVTEHARAGLPIYTVCSGVFALGALDLLRGRVVAAHSLKSDRLAAAFGCRVRDGLVRDQALTTAGGRGIGHVKALAIAMQIVRDHTPDLLAEVAARLDVDLAALPGLETVETDDA